jgi:Mn-dependent DtxR family transcriptional regulator
MARSERTAVSPETLAALVDYMARVPDATALEIAESIGKSRRVVALALSRLESEQQVKRTPRATHFEPDRWNLR